mmetsp:Transcript_42219/g.120397  ORF Transcript_42219/g.120397 Transcript_42219/m.120397 type:complete len:274 (-) Transcript_42219:154-975(-)
MPVPLAQQRGQRRRGPQPHLGRARRLRADHRAPRRGTHGHRETERGLASDTEGGGDGPRQEGAVRRHPRQRAPAADCHRAGPEVGHLCPGRSRQGPEERRQRGLHGRASRGDPDSVRRDWQDPGQGRRQHPAHRGGVWGTPRVRPQRGPRRDPRRPGARRQGAGDDPRRGLMGQVRRRCDQGRQSPTYGGYARARDASLRHAGWHSDVGRWCGTPAEDLGLQQRGWAHHRPRRRDRPRDHAVLRRRGPGSAERRERALIRRADDPGVWQQGAD